MSHERTRLPIMSDIIMYHNEPREKEINRYAPQPEAAFLGIEPYDKKFQTYTALGANKIIGPNSERYKTELINPSHGFSHTGSGLGVNYKPAAYDPRYNLPKYGNIKPQMINYSTRKSNLLFNN